MANVIFNLGRGSSSDLHCNHKVVVSFSLNRSVRQGCPFDPLSFAVATHPSILSLEHAARKGLMLALFFQRDNRCLLNCLLMTLLFFANWSGSVEECIADCPAIAVALGSKSNIEKSKMITVTVDNSFDPTAWQGEEVNRVTKIRHLGAPLGVEVFEKERFPWVMQKIVSKMKKWPYCDLHFWVRVKLSKLF